MTDPRATSPITTRWNSARIPDPDLHRLLRLLFGNDPSDATATAAETEDLPLRAVSGGGASREWSPRSSSAGSTDAGGVLGGSLSRPHRGGVA